MNEQNKIQSNQSGKVTGKDKYGTPVIIEWYKTNILSPDFAASMKNVWDIARQAYTPVEMQFLKAFPEVVGKEAYFKSFEPLFQNGLEAVDWTQVEETMQTLLQSHFIFDATKFSQEVIAMFANDICFFVSVRDQSTNTLLGFITFLVRAGYGQGDVKVMSFALEPSHQNRGLGKLLMSSLFKILPQTKRIFLCTRVTNDHALRAYHHWGFVKDQQPIMDHPFNLEHWSFLEYKADQCDILQKAGATLI